MSSFRILSHNEVAANVERQKADTLATGVVVATLRFDDGDDMTIYTTTEGYRTESDDLDRYDLRVEADSPRGAALAALAKLERRYSERLGEVRRLASDISTNKETAECQ